MPSSKESQVNAEEAPAPYWTNIIPMNHPEEPGRGKYERPLEKKDKTDTIKIAKQTMIPHYSIWEDGRMHLNEPGDTDGESYKVFSTPVTELMDFGVGIGLYYVKLLAMVALCFLIVLVLIPNMIYFDSGSTTGYRSGNGFTSMSAGWENLVRFSAHCNEAAVDFDPYSSALDAKDGGVFGPKTLTGCQDIVSPATGTCAEILKKLDEQTFQEQLTYFSKLERLNFPPGQLFVGHLSTDGWTAVTCDSRFPNGVPDGEKLRYCAGGKINTCSIKADLAHYCIGVLLVLLVLTYLFDSVVSKFAILQDEKESTASDFSIIINDPDPNATDPDEWKQFFEQCGFGNVVSVTVALNNGPLITLLAARSEIVDQIRLELAGQREHIESLWKPNPGADIEPEAEFSKFCGGFGAVLQAVGVGRDVPYWVQKQKECDQKIKALEKGPRPGVGYTAEKVFVVFDTEFSQRACLQKMAMGKSKNSSKRRCHMILKRITKN